MKQTVKMQEIQNRLGPGKITRDGFLGKDRRKLVDILTEDDSEVKRLGYDHTAIAGKMKYFRDTGEKGLGDFIDISPYFSVSVETFRGKLPCPFECRKILPKSITTVKNKRLGRELVFSDIQIHLIMYHGFYQGKQSQYRIEPRDLIDILEVEKPENKSEI